MLTAAEETAVLDLMRSAAVTERAERPSAAQHGIRWSDVPSGVYWGGVACEMAIVETQREDGRYRFRMVTVRDEPVELVVERRDPPEILVMRATVGSLGDRPAEAKRLVSEVRKALEALGRKPSFE